MPASQTRYIKRWTEFVDREERNNVPAKTRGIYALLKYRPRLGMYDVVYVGMAAGPKAGIKGRLQGHTRSKKKRDMWTHFSIFEFWDNISEAEIKELEGLFRQIYRKDTRANKLNIQKRSKLLKKVKRRKLEDWKG